MDAGTVIKAPSSTRQRWFLAGLLLLFVGLSVQYSLKALGDHNRDNRSAFLRWREQILDLDTGADIYQRYNYPNPPVMALLLYPLAKLPPLAGSLAWFYLKVGMALLALARLFQLVEEPGRPFPAWAKAVVVLLSLRPIMGDLLHGNVNLFIVMLVVAALYAFHQGRDLLAGVSLALAIACKVTPALFVPYFLWKRAWRTLAGCAVGLVLFLGPVPAGFLGWEENARLLSSWVNQMIKPFVVDGVVTTEQANQSLPGLAYRLATHSPSSTAYEDNKVVPRDFHNCADLDPGLVRWFLKGCMALFALVVVWSCRTPTATRRSWRLAAEFGLITLGMLLFSERTWKHHCVTLILPFAVIVYHLATFRTGPWLRRYLAGTLLAAALLMASTSTSLLEGLAKLSQVYGAYVWAYLLLAAALVVLLRRREDLPAPPAADGVRWFPRSRAPRCMARSPLA
jgi:hypothetical protein